MDFELTDEQRQFRDTLGRYLDNTFEDRRRAARSGPGVDEACWHRLAELGLLALPVPAEYDGLSGDMSDMLVVMEEMGRGLMTEPYWATVVAIEALRVAGGEAAQALLSSVAQGSSKLSVAFHEPYARYDLSEIATVAESRDGNWALTGEKSMVQHGAEADYWIVPARTDAGTGLFLVARAAPGAAVTGYRTIDGQRAANLSFNGTPARAVGDLAQGQEILEHVADYACVLLCAEAVGALDALNLATVQYTREREQFGGPIARFQALQHRMAEMWIQAQQARSITYLAAASQRSASPSERRRVVSAAKARVGQAARFVGEQAVQLHGGMGVSNEVTAAHWFKRLSIISCTLGDVDHHLARFSGHSARAGG
ncbi:acyl-CoA dehydrogenase family protein [Burkholderia multivorans]|uniref:acyl-CoA dehydrogenase family protein n=1 Tax=Burkholderia multivorans TaxID=87883 RepID=UPI0019D0330D|nr:acyl-CoA dehydrogenase family protein [Burkholderia multivorans]MBN6731254.1 acyl-CoA dehydrogenase family protein [Burkholderia multivorans]MBN6733476.1 acyl-CoA dehydrogenase family protein [Burkholderia multivorans]MBN7130386.1 pimeloyl-CoA dehydrogenase small subunit [Burkholderia multivorans]MBN8165068.1 pimeloyl-CoA dehydrogenase small subunit [Burkholderia multivorans]MBN8170857.1 pimeloyl-CoA dehydrogenase small subunit [Burkholderia multivorans]